MTPLWLMLHSFVHVHVLVYSILLLLLLVAYEWTNSLDCIFRSTTYGSVNDTTTTITWKNIAAIPIGFVMAYIMSVMGPIRDYIAYYRICSRPVVNGVLHSAQSHRRTISLATTLTVALVLTIIRAITIIIIPIIGWWILSIIIAAASRTTAPARASMGCVYDNEWIKCALSI